MKRAIMRSSHDLWAEFDCIEANAGSFDVTPNGAHPAWQAFLIGAALAVLVLCVVL